MIYFVADAMLGSLAKWLRILGYDTAYCPRWDDNELARLARAEGRALLTRDGPLARRPGLRVLLIAQGDLMAQLAQVIRAFDLDVGHPFTRCPVCNTPLEEVSKPTAWGQMPPFVFKTQDNFRLCPQCNRFYWRGTHWQRMQERLRVISAPPEE
jgi:uncharacterized protein with PIN domain